MSALDFPRPFASYVLLERLGAGGMSEVDLARRAGDDATGRFVVIKRIRTGSTDERAVRMFRDEARINGQLIHENIATVYDSGRVGDEWFLVMEYVPGMDLRGLQLALARAGRPFPPRVALTILCQVLRALQFAHTREDELGRPMQIVHRDVNPRNVMLSTRGEVKLIDFGVARAAERLERTETNAVKGKFAYMAPEQIEGNADIDGRVDLYAIGLMLHELLTGKSPFTGLTDVQILHRVLSGRLPGLPEDLDIPSLPQLRDIHARALALRPEERFEDADAFRLALESALVPLGGSAPQRMVAALLEEATGEKMREITERLRYWHEGSTAEVSFSVPPAASGEVARAVTVAGDAASGTAVAAPLRDRSSSGLVRPEGGAAIPGAPQAPAHAVTRATLAPAPVPQADDATVIGGIGGFVGAVSAVGPAPHAQAPAQPDYVSSSGTFTGVLPSGNTLAGERPPIAHADISEVSKPRNLLPVVGAFLGIAILAASFVAWQVLQTPPAPTPQAAIRTSSGSRNTSATPSPGQVPTQVAVPPGTGAGAAPPPSGGGSGAAAPKGVNPRSASTATGPARETSSSAATIPAGAPLGSTATVVVTPAPIPTTPPPDLTPSVTPEPVPSSAGATTGGNGHLSVVATGGKSEVYLDGRRVGATPLLLLPVSAGTHQVRLVNPDTKAEVTHSVTVTAGKLLPLKLTSP